MTLPLIPTTIVGSLPKPSWLAADWYSIAGNWRMTGDALREAQRERRENFCLHFLCVKFSASLRLCGEAIWVCTSVFYIGASSILCAAMHPVPATMAGIHQSPV